MNFSSGWCSVRNPESSFFLFFFFFTLARISFSKYLRQGIVPLDESTFYPSISLHRDEFFRFEIGKRREEGGREYFQNILCVRNVEENNGLVRGITCGKLESHDRAQFDGSRYFRIIRTYNWRDFPRIYLFPSCWYPMIFGYPWNNEEYLLLCVGN